MKSGKLNKPAKTLKNITKILNESNKRKGKHHNRHGSGRFGGFGGSGTGNSDKHLGSKDKTMIAVFVVIIGLVIISIAVFAIISKIRRRRTEKANKRAHVLQSLSRKGGDVDLESGECSGQESETVGSPVGLDMSDNFGEEKLNLVVGGEGLMPPNGVWSASDYTLLSGETVAATSGSAGFSSCAQNGSTGCESCAEGSTSHTPVPEVVPEVMPEQVVYGTDPEVIAPPSPMTVAALPSVLPEVQASTSPFVDAEETIGLADGGPGASIQSPSIQSPSLEIQESGEFNAENILRLT
ncbi:hypothetical protein TWF718_010859 [Orbilia javanica]|uniref:Uncharacterized protein n=1 Tax=Orbilia javanica TaxID=47235 RepID=A0AAN8MUZ4_9PEZI